MKRLFVMALCLASVVEARDRRCRPTGNRTQDCEAAPQVEILPASGVGTFGPCSTTAPTGAQGQVLTFARASSATCTKSANGVFATSGIANGDLVTLSSNQSRVEYDADGVPSLLVEIARTNSALRSEELENAAWTPFNGGSGVLPVVTANAGTAPDGTATADRVQFSACPAGSYSTIYQSVTGTGARANSIYCRGVSATQTISVCGFSSGGTGSSCTTVTCPSTSWSRGIHVATLSLSGGIEIGCQNFGSYSGGQDNGAADVLLWGGQDEAGSYASSYIPTAGATATRAADAPFFTIPAMEVQCLSAVVQVPAALAGNARMIAATSATTTLSGYAPGSGTSALHALQFVNPSSKDFTSSVNVTVSTSQRVAVWVNPSTQLGASVNGVESTTASGVLGAVTGVTKIYPGCYEGGTGFELGGHISRIQADPLYTRCTR